MNCAAVSELLAAAGDASLGPLERRRLDAHLATCPDCRAAALALDGLRQLRSQAPVEPPAGLFERIMGRSQQPAGQSAPRSRFWLGAGVGAAVAASVMVALLTTGVLSGVSPPPAGETALRVSLGEPRDVNIAIDMDHDLEAAEITVVLSGGIELDGYAGRRELSWTTDLKAGTNRLTLPIVAVGEGGGRLMVRVGHGDKERRFTLDLGSAT